jgi:DNA ligase 1
MRTVKQFETLYKKDSKDKIRLWEISVVEDDGDFKTFTRHGLDQEGANPIEEYSQTIMGKNIGRANETSPEEQAISDAQSDWNRKLQRRGYSKSADGVNKDARLRPMLAHVFADKKHKVKYPGYVQPKLNGNRFLAAKEDGEIVCWSRNGVPFSGEVLSEIYEELGETMEEGMVLDGEIYFHGADLQDIGSWAEVRRDETPTLEYHIYDYPSHTGSFKERHAALGTWFDEHVNAAQAHVIFVPTYEVKDEAELMRYESQFIKDGYEGLIFRLAGSKYQVGKRAVDLLKLKRFIDDEFEIVDFTQGTGRDEGTVIWVCKTKDDKIFNVRPKGSVDKRRELFNNGHKYVGKDLTVRFQEYSKDGIPLIVSGIAIRDKKH